VDPSSSSSSSSSYSSSSSSSSSSALTDQAACPCSIAELTYEIINLVGIW
jgi:hypothetical protein